MKCNQVQEILTAFVDDELDQHTTALIQQHLTDCRPCRDEYRLEQQTKLIVRRNIPPMPIPDDVADRLHARLFLESVTLCVESEDQYGRPHTWSLRIRKMLYIAGSTTAILALMMALLPAQSRHLHLAPSNGSIINETYNGFDGVQEGSFAPQFTSSNPGDLQKFFHQKLSFNVSIPTLHSFTLMGGNVSRYHNADIAQLVYKHGEDIVYIYEANNDSVSNGCCLNIPAPARDALLHTGWYVENHLPDCTLAVWKPNSTTLCCAMAEMPKDRLFACLTDSTH